MYTQNIDPSMIIPIALIVALGIIIYKGVKIVPQADAWVIERLGKYHTTLVMFFKNPWPKIKESFF